MVKDKNHKKERKKSRKRERDSSEERDRAAKLVSFMHSCQHVCKRSKPGSLSPGNHSRSPAQAKKVTRHLQKHSGAGHGYTDTDNPFGDSNVNQKFVWNKKIEKQIHAGTDIKELTARAEQQRQQARLVRPALSCLQHVASNCSAQVLLKPFWCGLPGLADGPQACQSLRSEQLMPSLIASHAGPHVCDVSPEHASGRGK